MSRAPGMMDLRGLGSEARDWWRRESSSWWRSRARKAK